MKYGILGLAAAAAWYGVTSPAHSEAATASAQQDEWSWRGRIADGRTLEVRGVNGSISAEPASGTEVEVTATKRARRSDPGGVRLEVVEHAEGVTICAVYPGNDNRCRPGGGEMRVRDNDVEVEFRVRLPRGVAFHGATVNGGVEAVNLSAPVALRTVNGGVRLETSAGDASAHTVNGSITAVVRAMGDRALSFQTVNGAITVSLPAGLNADLQATTVNGGIQSDFPVTVSGRMTPRRLNGRIGQGGRSLDLQTVNGGIRLRQLP